MRNIFTEHPNAVGESYFEHFSYALMTGYMMILGGLACILHAFFPFIFQQTASDILIKLTRIFVDRSRKDEARIKNLSQFINKKLDSAKDALSI